MAYDLPRFMAGALHSVHGMQKLFGAHLAAHACGGRLARPGWGGIIELVVAASSSPSGLFAISACGVHRLGRDGGEPSSSSTSRGPSRTGTGSRTSMAASWRCSTASSSSTSPPAAGDASASTPRSATSTLSPAVCIRGLLGERRGRDSSAPPGPRLAAGPPPASTSGASIPPVPARSPGSGGIARRFPRSALALSGVELLRILVVTDRAIRARNREWRRRRSGLTDVLSFPAGEPLPGSTGPRPLGGRHPLAGQRRAAAGPHFPGGRARRGARPLPRPRASPSAGASTTTGRPTPGGWAALEARLPSGAQGWRTAPSGSAEAGRRLPRQSACSGRSTPEAEMVAVALPPISPPSPAPTRCLPGPSGCSCPRRLGLLLLSGLPRRGDLPPGLPGRSPPELFASGVLEAAGLLSASSRCCSPSAAFLSPLARLLAAGQLCAGWSSSPAPSGRVNVAMVTFGMPNWLSMPGAGAPGIYRCAFHWALAAGIVRLLEATFRWSMGWTVAPGGGWPPS